jgi:heme O synthase-like polyprenyltransferase
LAIYVKDDYLEAKIPMLPVVFGSKLTSKAIMLSVIVTFFFALLFTLTGETSIVFGIIMSIMGLILIKSSYDLYKVSDKIDSPLKDEYRSLALSNFKVHNMYLGVMSLLLIFDMVFFYQQNLLMFKLIN